jgi:hypothetical protein
MSIQRIALLVLIIPLPLITLAQNPQVDRTVVLPTPTASDLAFAEMAVARLFNNGTWQISKTNLADLEVALPQVAGLKAEGWPAAIHIDHPEKYFRQYVAVIQGARKFIYVNAFCDERFTPYWRYRLVVVSDGATCYWQALFDPARHKFSDLMINSRA